MSPPALSPLPFQGNKVEAAKEQIDQIAHLLKAACARRISWYEAMQSTRPAAKNLATLASDFQRTQQSLIDFVECHCFLDFESLDSQHESRVDELRARSQPASSQLYAYHTVFERLSELYQDEVLHPFFELHRQYPHHYLWLLNGCLMKVEIGLQELLGMSHDTVLGMKAWQEDYMAYKRRVQSGVQMQPFRRTKEAWSPCIDGDASSVSEIDVASEEQFDLHVDQPVQSGFGERDIGPKAYWATSAPAVTSSFGIVEDQISRTHKRATTTTDYMLEDDVVGPPRFGSVFRRNKAVPRIFTGSFSELEQSIRKMQTEDAQNGTKNGSSTNDGTAAQDFAKQTISSFSSSPSLLLRRQPTEISKGTDQHSRDQALTSRSVSGAFSCDRARARTLNDTTGGLEAWLDEQAGAADQPTSARF